jgi:glycosyltransferase involved in cell wall biosynthesis
MKSNGLLVFVTTELHPFTVGGIGRFTYNLLKTLTQQELQRTVVLLTAGQVSAASFEMLFPGASLWQLSDHPFDDSQHHPNNALDSWLTASCHVLQVLRKLSQKHEIEYLEFPDWSGLGFATIQEKLARGFLSRATIAVRVHSTEAILVMRETRLLRPQDLRRYDLERKCYRDCDLVIAHLRTIAEETRRCFGIAEDEWWPRVHITAPPVDINGRQTANVSVQPTLDAPVLFTSKFQEFKKPQIFVQAAIGFLLRHPEYSGNIILACGGLNSEYAQKILKAIPDDLRYRFKVFHDAAAETRDDLISKGIVGFPTSFESFCLAAYEASLLGGLVILNGNNPAFGPDTPWIDGENCLKFDGSTKGLIEALGRAIHMGRPLATVKVSAVIHPWHSTAIRETKHPQQHATPPRVSAIIVNQNEGVLSADSLDSILKQDYSNLEIIYIDDGSQDSSSLMLFDSLSGGEYPQLVTSREPVCAGVAAARNWAAERASGDYLVFINPGDLLLEGYIQSAVNALESNSQHAVYVSQTAFYTNRDITRVSELRTETVAGEALISGGVINYSVAGAWVCRRPLVFFTPHRSQLGPMADWGWMYDVVAGGSRVIASPAIEVLVRERERFDDAEPISETAQLHHLLVANSPSPRPAFPIASLSQLTQATWTEARSGQVQQWYRHMIDNSYEGEIEFVAKIFGHTWLGRLIRTNQRLSSFLEKSVRWITRLPANVA